MNETSSRIVSCLVCATFFCFMTFKTVGAMQQSGYRNRDFLRWFTRIDNLFFNRLCVLSLCLFLSSTLTALCFSFLGLRWALCISAVPFLFFLSAFLVADYRYALKVPIKRTGRIVRLFAAYWICIFAASVLVVGGLSWLSAKITHPIWKAVVYAPFSAMPMVLPLLLCLANACTRIFENARNRRFVRLAQEKLKKRDWMRKENIRAINIDTYPK